MAMLLFSIASSSLLVINKLCLHAMPLPSFISAAQFTTASLTVVALMACGCVPTDHFEWKKVKPYCVYVGMFVMTIYCNMRALQNSNVETIIVFRACCPLVVCLLDWAFLGRQLPSARSALSLLLVLGGCAGYVATDKTFQMNGWAAYTWVSAYFIIISVEMAYGKHIVGGHLGFASMWGPTLYTNSLSLPPMLLIGVGTHEHDRIAKVAWSVGSITLLIVSCIVGIAISFLGFRARSLVTATCYTVLGVANKIATVAVNALIWDQHASPAGIGFLLLCLVGAAAYQQAPPIAEPAVTKDADRCASTSYCSAFRFLCWLGGAAALFGAGLLYPSTCKLWNVESSLSVAPAPPLAAATALNRIMHSLDCHGRTLANGSRYLAWRPPFVAQPSDELWPVDIVVGAEIQDFVRTYSHALTTEV